MDACPPQACGAFRLMRCFHQDRGAKTGSERQERRENPPDRTITHLSLLGLTKPPFTRHKWSPFSYLRSRPRDKRYRAFFLLASPTVQILSTNWKIRIGAL